jgi:hypothetical protein
MRKGVRRPRLSPFRGSRLTRTMPLSAAESSISAALRRATLSRHRDIEALHALIAVFRRVLHDDAAEA